MNEHDIFIEIAKKTVGEEYVDVLEYLLKKGSEMTDKDLATEMNVKDNEVRKKLYVLQEHGFITYRKVRDKETGWYIYYWKANVESLNEILLQRKREVLNKLKARLESDSSQVYYVCTSDGYKADFDMAMETDFKCPKCGLPLEVYDSERLTSTLKVLVEKLSKEIENETKLIGNKSS
jgi:transcription initiation factor TFIIE subunit alpha